MTQLESSANNQSRIKNHVQICDPQADIPTFSHVLAKPKNPLSSNEDGNWQKVTRPRKKERKEARVKVRPDVVIVKAEMPYVEILKKVKASEEVKATSSSINAVTKNRDGHPRVVLDRGSTNVWNITTAIVNSIDNDATYIRLTDTSFIEIRTKIQRTKKSY